MTIRTRPSDLPSRATLWAVCLVVLVAGVACQPASDEAEGPTEPAVVRIENAQLGVAIADLDPFFRLVSNEGREIVVEPVPDPTAEDASDTVGRLTIGAIPSPTTNINLVAAVEAHEEDLESRPNGTYSGQRELGGPMGRAYYSRGQFDAEDGSRQEETAIFTIHPNGTEILELTYVYPPDDNPQARLMDQLFVVFGEVEPFYPEPAAGDGEGADSGESEAAHSGEDGA